MSYYYNILKKIEDEAIKNDDSFFGWYNATKIEKQNIVHLIYAGLIITKSQKTDKIKLSEEGRIYLRNYEKGDILQKLILDTGISQSISQCLLIEIKKGNKTYTILSLIAILIATLAIYVSISLSAQKSNNKYNYRHHIYRNYNN
jgi:hypothetical protein